MNGSRFFPLVLVCTLLLLPLGAAEQQKTPAGGTKGGLFSSLKFRGIGPALMSGRIADIAVHPDERHTWYLAVGSGGVWKTTNAGTTFTPVFDEQSSYSIACITVDPGFPDTVWVGTGENSSGRHVGFGDGVYKSTDGGSTWQNMGLKTSEHIAKIVVHPENSALVYVAAEGPLWSAGGERGVYRSTDGGSTWQRILYVSEDTGVCDLVLEPGNPDVMIAAAYQRRRHVAAFMGGGPESGIYRSLDGGKSWLRMSRGLPGVDLGKIALAVSPQRPGVVYASVETYRGVDWEHNPGGFFRSEDRGATWKKMSDYFPAKYATGPHYYQELFADPHRYDHIYQMDAAFMLSRDGGKTWERIGQQWKHGDNHAMAFDPDNPDWMLVGSDGGLYESYDLGRTWRYFANLPVTQYYKMAIDNDSPFYHIIGGTQDNNTLYGPSRTRRANGIFNTDWRITVGGDGYTCAIDPEDPDTVYCEWQVGGMVRYDRRNGEMVDIKPQPEAGDPPPRWNWDAPLIISPHDHKRLYFGSQRLHRSDDRGDSWKVISSDLSRGIFRLRQPFMGRTWGPEAVFDHDAMSYYGNITVIAESPLQEGLLYCGTDDGLLQVSEDGGVTWRRGEGFAGVPKTAFVNDIKACLFDVNTVYMVLDNHKQGDFKPYIVVSTDRGRSWRSISGDLPERHITWALVQDHVKKDLLFAGTEFGIFFSPDGGRQWLQLDGGLPTIAFRDLDIQRRENDLVGASFGRGFYILDDYTPLRSAGSEVFERDAFLFPVRRSWLYIPETPIGQRGRGTQGASFYAADNPPFGAVFTYYVKEDYTSRQKKRFELDRERVKKGESVRYPEWDKLRAEDRELAPFIELTVRDETGQVVRRLAGPAGRGVHRLAWDLRYPLFTPTELREGRLESWQARDGGPLVVPGRYSVELASVADGVATVLGEAQNFEVVPLDATGPDQEARREILDFQMKTGRLQRALTASAEVLEDTVLRIKYILKSLRDTPASGQQQVARAMAIRGRLQELEACLRGDPTVYRRSEPVSPGIMERIYTITGGHWNTTTGPTSTHRRNYEIAAREFSSFLQELRRLVEEDLRILEKDMETILAPWTPRRGVPEWKEE